VKTIPLFFLSLISLPIISLSTIAIAGTVTKTSENKIILEFNNEPVPELNAKVIILDQESHKEIGFVEIVKIKDTRALGILKKGSAKPGDTADIASNNNLKDPRVPAKVNTNEFVESNRKEKRKVSRMSYGVGAELVNTQMMLKSSSNSGTLDGNGFGLRGALEYSLTRNWIIFGSLGLHPLVMTSTASEVTSINTNYLGTEGIVRYSFSGKRSEGLWIGGGAGYYMTMSSNVTPKPKSDFVVIGSAGYNIKLSSNYFSLKGDFVMFPSKKSNGYTYQAYQFVIGGVYFF